MRKLLAVLAALLLIIGLAFATTSCFGPDYTLEPGKGTAQKPPDAPSQPAADTSGASAPADTSASGSAAPPADTGGDDDEDIFGGE